MELPLVSIIIPVCNCEDFIGVCLESVFNLNYPSDKLDVIVVDNGSTDQSVQRAKKFPVKILHSKAEYVSGVRNEGVRSAKGVIFCFIDSDCKVSQNWLSAAVEILSRPGVEATGSGYILPESPHWIEKAWLSESKIEERRVSFIPCGNFIVTKDAFRKVGGFNENLSSCEDADICERLIANNYQIINSTKIESIHLRNPKTLASFLKKEMWYGYDMLTSLKTIFEPTFLFTCIFFVAHILLFISPLKAELFPISLVIIFILLNIAALHRVFYSRKYVLYGHILFLYYFYFLGRISGMIQRAYRLSC